MAVIKCKMCGGELVLTEGSNVAECEYCCTVQTVPSADNEKKLTLFTRANRLRFGCEFDKAAGIYESIVADFPEEAEAYWGLVLCKYGIEYVDDPATGKKIPTCHRSSFDSVMDDNNYEMTLEYADVVARKVYREEAKQIEEIRKGIIEVSGKEEPYDIFICYKETDERGQRTLDSVLAQDIYDALTEKGYRVFFARITLEDKLGLEYEPYIFAALNSAKLMLAVGTDYDYYNAVWVKNEWSRYLKLMAADKSRHLIPCYKGLDAYDMPKEFAKLQAQDLGKVGAMQDLLRGIDKLMPKMPAPEMPAPKPATAHGNAIGLGFLDIESGQTDAARNTFRQILIQDNSCAEAYLGMLLVCKDEERTAYTAKFRQYAGSALSDMEKAIFTPAMREKLLEQYCRIGDMSRVKQCLAMIPEGIDDKFAYRLMSVYPSVELVELLVACGATVSMTATTRENNKIVGKKSLLSQLIAENKANAALVECLLKHGADLRQVRLIENKHGLSRYSPLYDSVSVANDSEMAKVLLNAGANPNFTADFFVDDGSRSGKVPVINSAAEANMLDVVQELLDHGADPNAVKYITNANGESKYPVLFDAIQLAKSPELVRLLVSRGANINGCCHVAGAEGQMYIRSPLVVATCMQDAELVKTLLELGANPNMFSITKNPQKSDNKITPLFYATQNNNIEIAELLLKAGADPNINYEGLSDDGHLIELPLVVAAADEKNAKMLRLLLQYHADPNRLLVIHHPKWGDCYNNALRSAVREKKDLEMTKILLEAGADASYISETVSAANGTRTRACLLYVAAAEVKSVEMVKLLLQHGASVTDLVRKDGKMIPLKKHDLIGVPTDILKVLKAAGWRGPGLFG